MVVNTVLLFTQITVLFCELLLKGKLIVTFSKTYVYQKIRRSSTHPVM